MRAGGVEVLVARRRHVDHRRHVELAHRLPQRPPRAVPQRRPGPEPAGRVGVHVAPDEPHLARRSAAVRRPSRRCAAPGDCGSWHTGAKFVRVQVADAADRARSGVASSAVDVCSLPTWWPIQLARGENSVRSAPRSRWNRSWADSRLAADLVVGHRRSCPSHRRTTGRRRPLPPARRATRRPPAASSCSARGSR